MSKFKIDWLEVKSTEWTMVSLTDEAGKQLKDVSINKVSKKGEPFPNFDNLASGQEVEGELWSSPSGKHYLFPPRVAKTGQGGAFKTQVIKEAQDTKRRDITHFQGEKEYSIKVSSTFRAAVDSAIAEYQEARRVSIATDVNLEKLFEKWREYYWFEFDVTEQKYPPFK